MNKNSLNDNNSIYPKDWDTTIPFHTCPKLNKSIQLPVHVFKNYGTNV